MDKRILHWGKGKNKMPFLSNVWNKNYGNTKLAYGLMFTKIF